MTQLRFQRQEYKYLLNKDQYRQVKDHLIKRGLVYDAYSKSQPQNNYYVSSLYLDTQDYQAYWEKQYGVFSRSKYRLRTYANKAQDYLRVMVKWLQEHMNAAFEIEYQGRRKTLRDWAKSFSWREYVASDAHEKINFRDLINRMSGKLLATHFKDQAPDYPHFSVLITSDNRKQAAQDALRYLVGGKNTNTRQATAVLDALQLLDGDRLEPSNSRYSNHILDILKKRPEHKVVNRPELIQSEYGVEYLANGSLRLEPEWCVVILAVLVHAGELIITLPGHKFDASNLNAMAACSVDDLAAFKHIARSRSLDMAAIKALFELVGLTAGLAPLVSQGKPEPVQELQNSIHSLVNRFVFASHRVKDGLPFWGQALLSATMITEYRDRLDKTKTFLESLQVFSTPGRLKNLKFNTQQIRGHQDGLAGLEEVEALYELVSGLGTIAAWLSTAEAILPTGHEWVSRMRKMRQSIIGQLMNAKARRKAAFIQKTRTQLTELRKAFITIYGKLHTQARLGVNEEKKVAALKRDRRMQQLQRLASIDLMPSSQLDGLQRRLASLIACHRLTPQELETNPVCPHCSFAPNAESHNQSKAELLEELEAELKNMAQSWCQTLLGNLQDPTIQEALSLLKSDARQQIDTFVQSQTLPTPLDQDFIHAVREVLSGLEKISISDQRLREVLLVGGSPATVTELKERFERFLNGLVRGKDSGKVRIVLD